MISILLWPQAFISHLNGLLDSKQLGVTIKFQPFLCFCFGLFFIFFNRPQYKDTQTWMHTCKATEDKHFVYEQLKVVQLNVSNVAIDFAVIAMFCFFQLKIIHFSEIAKHTKTRGIMSIKSQSVIMTQRVAAAKILISTGTKPDFSQEMLP